MTERDTEDALRRSLREVADRTAAAAHEPPPLHAGTVVPLAGGRARDRWLLGGLAAAVVLVAAVVAGLVVGGGGDSDESVEVADDPTTSTTDEPATSSTSSSSTSTSVVPSTTTPAPTATTVGPPPAPRGELLSSGEGWEVRLRDGCVVVLAGGRSAGEECDRDRDAWLLAAPLADGRTVHVAGGRRVVTADGYSGSGLFEGDLPVWTDSGTGRYVVTDDLPEVVLLREGTGGDWVAGVYGGELVDDGLAFAGWPGYQRATGSLSFGRFQEIGGYYGGGDRCVVARQVTPGSALLADHCLTGGAQVAAVLVATEDPDLFDLFGIATAVGAWRCVLPDGGSCGTGQIAGIAGFAGIIAQRGPIAVGGGATEVVIETDGGSVTVPVPR